MRKDFWEFEDTAKFVLSTNHKPQVDGDDEALWRRLVLVPFTARFWDPDKGETGEPELRINRNVREQLKKPEVSAAILAWAVAECLEWRKNGLGMPAKARAATLEYQGASDVISEFIQEKCEVDPEATTGLSRLYAALKLWAKEREIKAPGRNRFSKALEGRFERKRSNGTQFAGVNSSPEVGRLDILRRFPG
ncbi:MAG TPA: hypothetical protein VGP76_06230 [Planctomycetaceae bacterium]|jgi:putative DNA primase/helicase|nr:hypothetical protein [Planctomycetaceae bacterium]